MKIQIHRNLHQRHRENNPGLAKNFQAGEELPVERENIQKLLSGEWEFCYFDSDKRVTYPFYITLNEIKNGTTEQINHLLVKENEFEELIKIPEIKELIDLDRVMIKPTPNDHYSSLFSYEPFLLYYEKLSKGIK